MVGADETTELGMAGPQFWSDNFFFNIEIEKYVPTYCVTFSQFYNIHQCGQSYKQFTLLIQESGVVIWGIFKSGMTLEL